MREFLLKQNRLPESGPTVFTRRPQNNAAPEPDAVSFSAGMAFNRDFSRVPPRPATPPVTVQPKLAIGSADDTYEREADRIAEQVTAEPGVIPVSSAPLLIQRFRGQSNEENTSVPASVEQTLASPGSPLEPALRQDMEQRFGHDFSHIRVHTDSRAAESAQAVNALAYTAGKDIVFGAGEFSPQSAKGKRLLAHELTHTVQQNAANSPGPLLQRAPKDKPQKRRDIVIVGDGWKGASELSKVVSSGALVIKVKSSGEVAAALAKINFPVGTVFFITHSSSDGSLKFGDAESYIAPADLAGKLKGVIPAGNTPQGVDFRGCSVGTTPASMDQIRTALGAQTALAGTCYAVIDHTHPVKIGGKEITKESDVTNANRKKFEDLKNGTFYNFTKGERKCVLNKSDKDFFAAGGRFVTLFFNPEFTGAWIPGKSVCYGDMVRETVDPKKPLPAGTGCKLIQVQEKNVEPYQKKMREFDDPHLYPAKRFLQD